MKKLIFIALLMPLLASAQTNGDRVYIVKPEKIFRNYNFTEDDEKVMKKTLDKAEIPIIRTYSKPDSWPRSISAVKGFNMNADTIKKYVAYFVCDLPSSGNVIVVVPIEGNEEISEHLRPKQKFYFVVRKEGVSADEPEEKKPAK